MRSAPKLGLLQTGHAARPVRCFGGATRLAFGARSACRFPMADGPRLAMSCYYPTRRATNSTRRPPAARAHRRGERHVAGGTSHPAWAPPPVSSRSARRCRAHVHENGFVRDQLRSDQSVRGFALLDDDREVRGMLDARRARRTQRARHYPIFAAGAPTVNAPRTTQDARARAGRGSRPRGTPRDKVRAGRAPSPRTRTHRDRTT